MIPPTAIACCPLLLRSVHGARDSYFDWTAVGMALHAFDLGLADEFDHWSQQSAKYREGESCAEMAVVQRRRDYRPHAFQDGD